jgi:hypothetical protein
MCTEEKTKEDTLGFRGFGHEFEKKYTKVLDGSTGHHRIVNYRFGILKCLVRYETDGYVAETAPSPVTANPQQTSDSLALELGRLSISKTEAVTSSSMISIESGGREVESPSTLEIKTRTYHRPLDMSNVLPQLWISQTPNLVIGYHQKGIFKDVQLQNMIPEIQDWENANQKALQSLQCLLKRIIQAAESSPTGRAIVVKYDSEMSLKIFSGDKSLALPNELYSKWTLMEQKEGDVLSSSRAPQQAQNAEDSG